MNQSPKSFVFNLVSLVFLLSTCYLLLQCTDPTTPPDNGPDTTSHNFTWHIDTVGSYGSIFRDVAVINDSLIYACGEIKDDDREQYGLAIWNGEEWKLKYLRLSSMSGGSITPDGMYPETENKIWFASGSIFLLNGSNFSMPRIAIESEGYVRKVWASSKNDIWFVGTRGLIIHYDGSSFTTMEKLTDIELTDVWGTGPDNVWACGYTRPDATVILHYDGSGGWSKFHERSFDDYIHLDTNVISGPASNLWTNSIDSLWLVNYWGLYRVNSNDSNDFNRIPPIWYGGTFRIKARASNDIMFCSDRSAIWHYNGSTAKSYPQLAGQASLRGISFLSNGFILVGTDYDSGKAIVYRGKR